MDAVLDGLNAAQRAAVTSPASVVQVLAPPGSGKTKTLTARVAYLIANNGLLPRNIIVCTFTIKAAKEMKDRICDLLGEDLSSKLLLGTFHSIARRFLASYGKHIGLESKFSIADSTDSLSIIKRIAKRLNATIEPKIARSRISRLKAKCISPEQHAAQAGKAGAARRAGSTTQPVPGAEAKMREEQEFFKIYSEYEKDLSSANLLDFDDLLVRCAELLRRCPQCVSNIEAVLIDEFQDTNSVQFDLMHLFAQQKQVITTVGDPDQSIYGWRSAEIENLKKMQVQFPDTHVATLEENYRSSGAILAAALEIIEQDTSRFAKTLMPTHSVGLPPVLRRLPGAASEASWIVSEIQRATTLSAELLKWSDFAVLLRSAALSRLIEASLGKAGIPYRMIGGNRFFDRLEVRIVLDYLRVVHHSDHDDAVVRIVNVPNRGIGETTLQRLLEQAHIKRLSLWTLILNIVQGNAKSAETISSKALKGLEQFVGVILASKNQLKSSGCSKFTLADFLRYVLKKICLKEYLEKHYEKEDFQSRWANVQELIAQASDSLAQMSTEEDGVIEDFGEDITHENKDHDEIDQDSYDDRIDDGGFVDIHSLEEKSQGSMEEALSRFLANVALSTEVQKEETGAGDVGQITLSTIHAAKGLEWPVVFIPAAYQGSIPHSRAEDNDEERRLLYVAMTRAKSLLYLSCPTKDSQRNATTLSSFLTTNQMSSHLSARGARFDFEVIKEVASILRRPCPSSSQMESARSNIEHAYDNLWPLSGEYSEESRPEDDMDSESMWGFSANKRRRDSDEVNREQLNRKKNHITLQRSVSLISSKTTFTSQSEHTITKATFVSASSLPKMQVETQQAKRQSSATKLKSGQQNLQRFLTSGTQVQGSQRSISKSKNDHSTTDGAFAKSMDISKPKSEHDLGPVRKISLAEETMSRTHLPSSIMSLDTGPKINALRELANVNKDMPKCNKIAVGTDEETQHNHWKPATTLHSTSMGHLSSISNSMKTYSYGAKPSFNGWANRKHK